jgi:hypothetical protein
MNEHQFISSAAMRRASGIGRDDEGELVATGV